MTIKLLFFIQSGDGIHTYSLLRCSIFCTSNLVWMRRYQLQHQAAILRWSVAAHNRKQQCWLSATFYEGRNNLFGLRSREWSRKDRKSHDQDWRLELNQVLQFYNGKIINWFEVFGDATEKPLWQSTMSPIELSHVDSSEVLITIFMGTWGTQMANRAFMDAWAISKLMATRLTSRHYTLRNSLKC